MAGDVLSEMLAIVRAANPEIPADRWHSIELALRMSFGGDRHYINRRSKATLLDCLEIADQADYASSNEKLSQLLGVSVRRVQQIKRLNKG